jgi:hypothetical protein
MNYKKYKTKEYTPAAGMKLPAGKPYKEEQIMELAKAKGIGRIWRCECGAIKVQCNFVTLHLEEEFFLQFANMLDEASRRITEERFNSLFTWDLFPGNNHPGRDR